MSPRRNAEDDDISLRQYLEKRLDSLQATIIDRFEQHARVVDKVENQVNKRFEDMSQHLEGRFREIQQYKEATRKMAQDMMASFDQRLRVVEQHKSNMEGRMVVFGAILGIIVVILNVFISFFLQRYQ